VPDRRALTGWGRTASTVATHTTVPTSELAAALRLAGPRGVTMRGLGRSYGDAAQNGGGLVLELDHDLAELDLDPAAMTVTVGAGVSLDALMRALLPRGFFVPVTPGTRFVTVGGAIAADIHGKNHHVDGSLGNHVVSMSLLDSSGQVRVLGPETTPNEFWATVGGMGLTGVVVEATLRVRPVETAYMRVDTERAANLDDLLAIMAETDDSYTYSVAWIDLLSRGRSMGRAVLTRGEHARMGELARGAHKPLDFAGGQRLRAPSMVPTGLMNPLTVRAFNELWFRKAPKRRLGEIAPLAGFFHPLDGIADWNRLYGRRGFVQYQFVVPFGAEDVLRRAVDEISAAGHASFLAVLKRFGPGNPAPLSFPMAGWTLALDLPASPALSSLLDGLDELVMAAGGRIYLAKDSRARRDTIAQMYPRLPEFAKVCDEMDPDGIFTSDLARRVGLRAHGKGLA
jgi:decaprenylphospho-beta-D-ribofuranose 2-oxidase